MSRFNKFLAVGCLVTSALSAYGTDFGYCTSYLSRDYIFRMGSTERQGTAIRLSHDKLQMLKGTTIRGISAAFGSSRTNDGSADLFVTTSLDSEPLLSQNVQITSAVKWLNYEFDSSYTITGDEPELYIGYIADINVKSSMLMADYQADTEGCSYVYVDGQWVDTFDMGCGNVMLRLNIDDAPQLADLMLKPVAVKGYFKAQTPYCLSAQVFNFGNVNINDFDLKVTIEGEEPFVLSCNDVALEQGMTYDVALPEFMSSQDGDKGIVIEALNINGAEDADSSDNAYATSIYYYPSQMERSILLEGFTGQKCSNCPTGHATIASFVESVESLTPIIEVMHHSGYQPDIMSMDADFDYTFLYGSSSTYAPAVMLNRYHLSTIGNSPVMNTTASNLAAAYAAVSAQQPYVSLSLDTSFDPITRQVNISMHSYAHTDLPEGDVVLNVMLVQNGILSYQTPYGSNYTHNAVFRGVLTGNSWGVLMPAEATAAGGCADWSKSFVLPETIFSDYWNVDELSETELALYNIAAVPEDMYIVAYVGAYDGYDCTGHTVYNAVAAPLGKSYTQSGMATISDVMADVVGNDIKVSVVDRHVIVNGYYDNLYLYSIDGNMVNADAQLAPGIYVVHVVCDGVNTVKKILVK